MGEVYRAKDTKLHREVAIKVLPADVASSPERLLRFEREATTVAALNHPNIVTIFGIEESGDHRFIAMELVEGETLDRMIAPGGMPVAKIFDIAIPLSDALATAHDTENRSRNYWRRRQGWGLTGGPELPPRGKA
jgi:serine/threonine protein kinase